MGLPGAAGRPPSTSVSSSTRGSSWTYPCVVARTRFTWSVPHAMASLVDVPPEDIAGRRWPAAHAAEDSLGRQQLELRIRVPDRMLFPVTPHRVIETVPGLDPLAQIILAEEEAQEILGRFDILGELPDAIGTGIGSEEAACRTRWRRVVVDVVGDREFLVHGHRVRTHGVVDPGAPAGVEAAVVARIVPGEHLRLHCLRI